jgi:hypothetical protein
MFIIWGIRRKLKGLGQMGYDCAQCGRSTSHTTYRERSWLTLFFLPVIPLSKKFGLSCNVCGRRLRAVGALEAQLRERDQSGSVPMSETLAS